MKDGYLFKKMKYNKYLPEIKNKRQMLLSSLPD